MDWNASLSTIQDWVSGKKRTPTAPAACTRSSSAGQSRYWTGFSVATGRSALSAAERTAAFAARGAHGDQAATDRVLLQGGAGGVDAVRRCGAGQDVDVDHAYLAFLKALARVERIPQTV